MDNAPHRRRHPLLKLRGLDPVLLEVQAQEMLRRPTSQIEPANVCDLVALAELPDAPKALSQPLQLFVGRAGREIADIPNGRPWLEFLEEYAAVEGYQVPETFRGWLMREMDRGEAREPDRIHAVLAEWAKEPPEPFELGNVPTKVVTVEHPAPESGERSPRARTSAPRAPKPVSSEDLERKQWIAEVVLERVAQAPESGLGEHVLVAGVRHRAKERYPTLVPADVTVVLRELKDTGRIRYSAGRWAAVRRY